MKNIKLLLWILTLVILNLLLQQNNTGIILACGLFGFVGVDPKNNFSWDKFNILGLYNDSRGGDACGRIIGNSIQWGVEKLKNYKDFATTAKNIKLPDKFNIALGHCRKASSGGKDHIYAQPIILKKKDVNMKAVKNTQLKSVLKGLDAEEIVFSGIHNGTIDNYIELAREYGIPLEGHNDSRVLLSILFYGNYEVLSKYNGTAALIWHNHITNKSYFFKGESKYIENSVNTSEERPLYYWEISKGNYYFSSIEDSLMFIGADKDDVIDMSTNVIYVFKDGVKTEDVKIDRSKCLQSKSYSGNTGREFEDENDIWYKNYYGYSHYRNYEEGRKKFEEDNKGKQVTLPLPLPKLITQNNMLTESTKKCIRVFSTQKNPYRIQGEILDSYLALSANRIAYNKGRYWMHGGLLHGIYILNNSGIVPAITNKESSPIGIYYFIEGIMMDSFKSYNEGMAIHYGMMQELKIDPSQVCNAERDFVADIALYSEYPISTLTNFTDTQDCVTNIPEDSKEASVFHTGNFAPTFSDKRYAYYKGELVSIIEARTSFRADHKEDDIVMCNSYSMKCTDLKETDPVFTIGYDIMYKQKRNPFSPLQNIIFSSVDLKTSKDMDLILFLLNYLRDFRSSVRLRCEKCVLRDDSPLRSCLTCDTLIGEFNDQIPLMTDYGIYND